MRVKIATISPTYCHTVSEDGERVFIHQQESDFAMGGAQIGDVLEVESIEETARGLRGHNAMWVERPSLAPTATEELEGVIVHVDYARKFAFVRPSDKFTGTYGRSPFDVLAHISGAADYNGESQMFDRLARGVTITGVIRDTARGRRLENYSA
jgi:hypothetical protein